MSKVRLPPLTRLSEMEARSIESCFRLYDYKASGRIPQHLAYKLCQTLGFDFSIHSCPQSATLKEFLLFLDMRVSDPEPALHSQMHNFVSLAAKPIEAPSTGGLEGVEDENDLMMEGNSMVSAEDGLGNLPFINEHIKNEEESQSKAGSQVSGSQVYTSTRKFISTKSINDFMEGLGRPPVSESQCNLMLEKMLDYDDCSERSFGKPAVDPDYFMEHLTHFAKKSNALKNFK